MPSLTNRSRMAPRANTSSTPPVTSVTSAGLPITVTGTATAPIIGWQSPSTGILFSNSTTSVQNIPNGTPNQLLGMNPTGTGYQFYNPVTLGTYQVVADIPARDALGTVTDGSIVLVQSVPPRTNVFYVRIAGTWYEVGFPFYLADLGDVTITSPVANNVLTFDGTNWVNTPIASLISEPATQIVVGTGTGTDSYTTFTYDPSSKDFRVNNLLTDNVAFEILNSFNTTQLQTPKFLAGSIAAGNGTFMDIDDNLELVRFSKDHVLIDYPQTRDDSSTTTPINFLYTDATGKVLSSPILSQPSKTKDLFNPVSGASVTLSNVPTFIYSVRKNGKELVETLEWTYSSGNINFVNVLSNDVIEVVYES